MHAAAPILLRGAARQGLAAARRRLLSHPAPSALLSSAARGDEAASRLAEQARRRPLSPHLTIYQPQLTSLMSIGHRLTGAALAALLYAGAAYYAVAPAGAVSIEQLVEAVAALARSGDGLVEASLYGAKVALGLPFFFHSFNGIRHLVWDTGRALSLRATYVGGWLVNGASVAAAVAAALLF